MKKKFKHYAPLIITILLFISFISIYVVLSGYKYNSDIECINSVSKGDEYFELEKVLFKFENDKKELIFYNSKNNYVITCELYKKEIFGEQKYKFKTSSTSGLNPLKKEWQAFDENIEYIFVQYERDIEDIDCKGYTPVGTKIPHKISTGEETSCWIYVIDKSPQNTDN